jgi:hypothetical protein
MTTVWKVKDGETVVCVLMTEVEADVCLDEKIQTKTRKNLLSNSGVPEALLTNKTIGQLYRMCNDMGITEASVDIEKANVTEYTKESVSV